MLTPNGTTYSVVTTTLPNGEPALYGKADGATTDVPLVLYCHGNGGDYNQFNTLGAWSGLRNLLIDSGYAWVESLGGGLASWGNAASRTSYEQAYTWAASQFDVGPVVVLGRSMGGLPAYWLAKESTVVAPHVVGLIINSGVTDLAAFNGPVPGKSYIRTAHGISSDGSGWEAWLDEYDPMRMAPGTWAGEKVMQLWGTNDTTVPPGAHAQAWITKYGTEPALLSTDERAGGDHSGGNGSYLQVEPMGVFLAATTGVPMWEPEDPEPPADPLMVGNIQTAYITGDDLLLYAMDLGS